MQGLVSNHNSVKGGHVENHPSSNHDFKEYRQKFYHILTKVERIKPMRTQKKNIAKIICTWTVLLTILLISCNIAAFTAAAEPDENLPEQITSDVVPDGIYAFKNLASQKWMDVEYDSSYPGYHMQQYAYSSSPANGNAVYGLYRVTQIENTGRYIIRLLLNEELSFGLTDDSEVLTKDISAIDSEVDAEDTFVIEHIGSGRYTIQPYGSNKFLRCYDLVSSGSADAPDSYLTSTTNGSSNLAKWILQPYQEMLKTGVYWISNNADIASGSNPRIMDAEGPSYASGTPIQQWKDNNPEQNGMYYAQIWIVRNIGCGYYTISSSKKLDMYMSCNGTAISLKESMDSEICDDSSIQWKIEGNTQKGFTITSKLSSAKAITAPDNIIDGSNLICSAPTTSNEMYTHWNFNRIDNVYIASIYSITDTTGASSGGSSGSGSSFGDLGHSWIKFENLSIGNVIIGAATVGPNEYITVGKWGNQKPKQLWYNLERHFSESMTTDVHGGYISTLIRSSELEDASAFIIQNHTNSWTPTANCSEMANALWYAITGSAFTISSTPTPYKLLNSMKNHSCYIEGTLINEGIWRGYYENGELHLATDGDVKPISTSSQTVELRQDRDIPLSSGESSDLNNLSQSTCAE